ncbi:MAG: CBASS cGAMP synthase [Bacteroidota bacterium]
MATLHKEYNEFYKKIKLTGNRKEGLTGSRKSLRKKIKDWFAENKPDKLQPKFEGQGSFEMNTTINPIVIHIDGEEIRKYDLDDGVYFHEKEGENNREKIDTWHNWVYEAVKDHTQEDTIRKNTCVRVVFSDGHHIDLPIYYKNGDTPELAHRSKGWSDSDPVEFTDWFKGKANDQKKRLVRYIKAWKDFRHNKNSNLKLPSGFALTILVVNNYVEKDNDDAAFRETIRKMYNSLSAPYGFKCLRPTTPKNEDVFAEYSKTRKDNFLTALNRLLDDCDKAKNEKNFKKASEYLIDKQFDNRFPKGADKDEEDQKQSMSDNLNRSYIKPKPYAN